jgi:hypothetical protein
VLPRGYRRATSGSGSSTFQSSSVLTGTAELAAPVTNLRIIDQLTQPADPSQTASKQEAATGSAGGPETSGASPTFNRIQVELHGPSDRLVQQVVNVCSATRWEGVCAAPVFVLAAPARPVDQMEPS